KSALPLWTFSSFCWRYPAGSGSLSVRRKAFMIELRNINFRYAGGTDAGRLMDIDLTIPDGQVVLLCGQSGCGKTTLTRLVNGLIPNYYEGELSGEVLLDGKNISSLPLYETSKYVG